MDIGKGDWVECVDPWDYTHVTKGAIYVAAEIDADCDACEECGSTIGVGLVSVADPEAGCLWCAGCQFRPIYRPRESTLIADLTKTPQFVGIVTHAGFHVLDID